ncbi:DUF799 domain-containing protein [Proteus terrae]|uniref:DUF799 domain-containing protein n=1 Tax=Proteus terrae TaxID=1574161 RepID=UPI0013DFF4D5|nr:DUF799 domain-containing protein [Proteus terrae]QIF99611.1 hypothetical protein GTH25_16835 [Proteus terrae subsp. cibarius]
MSRLFTLICLAFALILTGCAQPVKTDYSAFRQSKPKSILVLVPQNHTTEVGAGHSFLSQVTYPLAEAGYYVFPVAVVEETFKQNGLSMAGDIHAVSPNKLREIFGADTVLYLDITEFGTSYQIISSDTRVTVAAKLVDLRNGGVLWSSSATASSTETEGSSSSLVGMLVSAVVNQIVNTVSDKSYQIAGITSVRLLSAGNANGILYGPRSPNYGKEAE